MDAVLPLPQEDEDVVLALVVLRTVVVFFLDIAFCANAYIVVKFSATIKLATDTDVTIKAPN